MAFQVFLDYSIKVPLTLWSGRSTLWWTKQSLFLFKTMFCPSNIWYTLEILLCAGYNDQTHCLIKCLNTGWEWHLSVMRFSLWAQVKTWVMMLRAKAEIYIIGNSSDPALDYCVFVIWCECSSELISGCVFTHVLSQ